MTTTDSIFSSVVRTVVPVLVGSIISWAAQIGIDLPNSELTTLMTIVITALYYAGARWIELNMNPTLGRMLLSFGLTEKAPIYTNTDPRPDAGTTDTRPDLP